MEMTTPVFSAPRSTSGTNSSGASMQFVIEKKMGGAIRPLGQLQCSRDLGLAQKHVLLHLDPMIFITPSTSHRSFWKAPNMFVATRRN
jgi:hypothetical protein